MRASKFLLPADLIFRESNGSAFCLIRLTSLDLSAPDTGRGSKLAKLFQQARSFGLRIFAPFMRRKAFNEQGDSLSGVLAPSPRPWRPRFELVTSLLMLGLFFSTNSAHAQSEVYKYTWGGQNYSSIDALEAAMRSNPGFHNAELAFPIITDGSWTLDYRPLGALTPTLSVPPQSISTPYFAVNKAGWPPEYQPSGYCSVMTDVYSACQIGGAYKWCNTLEKEVARFSCQINYDINYNGTYVMQPGYPAFSGQYPVAVTPTDIDATITFPPSDPAGLGRKGGRLTYQIPAANCTFGNCPNTPFISVKYDLASSRSEINGGDGVNEVLATYTNAWGIRRAQFFWCPPSVSVGTTAADPCSDTFKVIPTIKTPKQHDQCTDGNPCAPGNGNKEQEDIDFVAGNVSLARHYNSLRELRSYSFFDLNWHHSYGQRVLVGDIIGNHSPVNQSIQLVQNERGHAEAFRRVASGEYRSTVQSDVVMFKTASPVTWVIVYPSGRVERYDAFGRIRKIEYAGDYSRNLDISYVIEDGAIPANTLKWDFFAVSTVKDIAGRGIRFVYDNSVYVNARVSEIREIGLEIALVSYQYDSVGRLWKATTGSGTREYLYGETGYVTSPAIFKRHLTGIKDELGVRYGTYTYDSAGRVKSSTHPGDAGKVTVTYTNDSQVVVTRPEGNATYQYRGTDAFRRPKAALDSDNRTSSSTLNSEDGSCSANDERVCKTIDRRGTTTKFDYNSLFRISTTHALGTSSQRLVVVDRFAAEKLYQRSRLRIENAASLTEKDIVYTRNSRGQVLTVTEQAADVPSTNWRTSTYAYCEQADVTAGTCPIVGLLKSIDGPRTDVVDITLYTYRGADASGCVMSGAQHDCPYRKGDVWKVQNAVGHVVEYVARDGGGRVLREKDANGVVTDSIYHARGWLNDRIVRANLTGSPSPADATTTFDYDAIGNVKKVIQPDGSYHAFTYDDAHRLIRIKDNLGNEIEYCLSPTLCLDQAGNRRYERTKDPNGVLVRSLRRAFHAKYPNRLAEVYNASNQMVEAIPGGSIASVDRGYDANGNVLLSWDGQSIKSQRYYDPLNRLSQMVRDSGSLLDPATQSTTTEYSYDARDNLRSVKDPGTVENPAGLTTTYTYDGLNNLTQLQSPDTGTSIFTYDPAGNREKQTDARGVDGIYGYDAMNRLKTITYANSALDVSFFYDEAAGVTGCANSFPLGRLTRMLDGSGSTTYCYDRRGNITHKTQVTPGITQMVIYSWSLANRLETITYPSGGVVTYVRDNMGQVVGIRWKANGLAPDVVVIGDVKWYPFGPLKKLTFGNGRTLTKTYDLNYAIDSIASSDPNGLVLDLTPDVMGNIVAASNTLGATTPTQSYVYDRLYRLKQVTSGGTGGASLESYMYNRTGDRIEKTVLGQSPLIYTYLTGTHRLSSVGGVSRNYDANGNTTSLPEVPYPLVYDDRNRLTSVMLDGAPSPVSYSYAYNGRGERVRKAEVGSTGTTTQTALYDESGHLLREHTSRSCGGSETGRPPRGGENLVPCGGNRLVELVYLDDLPIAQITDGAISYLETDHLGTPRVAANPATNAWQWKWDFFGSAFGEHQPIQAATGGIEVSLRYPGQRYDAEAGLHYNYFRDYEPGTGRYVESDPIGLEGGMNTYSYVFSSPLKYIDPAGLGVGEYFNCLATQIRMSENKDCWKSLVKSYAASASEEFEVACKVLEKGIVCTSVCTVKEFIGSDVYEVVFNAHKQAIISALDKTAKEVATKAAKRFLPMVGQIDLINDGYKTIRCTTDCVMN